MRLQSTVLLATLSFCLPLTSLAQTPQPVSLPALNVPTSNAPASGTPGPATPALNGSTLNDPALPPVNVPGLKMPGPYQLRPGDSLSLAFRLSPELNQTVTIDTDGTVSLDLIGRLELEGLTIDGARRLIIARESEHLLRPEINIQLTNPQRSYVVVAGEVNLPSRLELRDDMTALQAVMLAGGMRTTGSQTNVLLYRKVNAEYAEVRPLNLKIHKTAELERDTLLQPGDLIVVSRTKVESVARYTRIVGLGYNFDPRGF